MVKIVQNKTNTTIQQYSNNNKRKATKNQIKTVQNCYFYVEASFSHTPYVRSVLWPRNYFSNAEASLTRKV